MTIPDYQSIMLPLLKFAGDKKEHSIREAIDHIADLFKLSEEQKKEVLPSGRSYIIDNRVGWARTYLKKAELLEDTRRSHFRITEEGLGVLVKSPTEINIKFLQQFTGFNEFRKKKDDGEDEQEQVIQEDSSQTPQELLEYGYQKIKRDLAQELIESVKKASPRFFEQLVVELLLKMGYGGSLKDAGKAIGQSGDGGIDGIIKEDKLGLDVIYIQAKRWENVVGEPVIRNFVGSLVRNHANKGVLITTSYFTNDAKEYVNNIPHKVSLINGEMLAQLMIENNVGVSGVINYEVKKIDSDYFIEE